MLGIVTQKYHNLQIESLKKEFDEKLSDVTLSLSKSEDKDEDKNEDEDKEEIKK